MALQVDATYLVETPSRLPRVPTDVPLGASTFMEPDDLDAAVDEIRACIGDLAPYQVSVERRVYMLPSLVEPDAPVVRNLQAAYRGVRGADARTFYGGGIYDLGGLTSAGVPAVMFGSSAGDWPLGIDFVPLSHVVDEANIVARLVLDSLT